MGDRQNQGDYGEVLSSHRRQLVISQLQSHGSMTLRDLAEQIAVSDQQTDLESMCEEAVKEVEVALHHVHAPKLAEVGYVEYDPRQRLVGLTDTGRRLNVETECGSVEIESSETVTVELGIETIDKLHEQMRQNDRLSTRMSYNEAINTLLSHDTGEDADETPLMEDEEEAT